MFHGMNPAMKHRSSQFLQMRKATNATFIFHVREPPTLTKAMGNWSNHFFDATMTYRRDSTVFNALYEFVSIKAIPPRLESLSDTSPDPDIQSEYDLCGLLSLRDFISQESWKAVGKGRTLRILNQTKVSDVILIYFTLNDDRYDKNRKYFNVKFMHRYVLHFESSFVIRRESY